MIRPKIEILVKNRNFGQKSKFWSKIEILAKNRNFGPKSKLWLKIELLFKKQKFGQTSKFRLKHRHNKNRIFEITVIVNLNDKYFQPKYGFL